MRRRVGGGTKCADWNTGCSTGSVTQPARVHGKDGWQGIVHRWPEGPQIYETDEIVVRLDSGETLAVAASLVMARPDGSYFVPLSLDEIRGAYEGGNRPLVIPVIHEELEVAKRTVETGSGVRIEKRARDEEQVVDLPLIEERVEVDRVPIDRTVDAPVPVRHVGDTIVVPVMQEVLVVQKQWRLVEELHIRKIRTERSDPRTVVLRKEEAFVERLENLES